MFEEVDPSAPPRGARYFRISLILSLLLYLIFVALVAQTDFYQPAMRHLGVPALEPIFIDMYGPLSWLECAEKGIDVISADPCDVPGPAFNYGHGVFLLQGLGLTTGDRLWLGTAMAVIFFATLLALLKPATGKQAAYCCALVISSSVMFAAERANLDVLIFLLLTLSALLLTRKSALRFGAYGIIFLGGLIKFYPWAVLALTLRERTRTCLLVVTFSAAALLLYVMSFSDDLAIILSRLPGAGDRISFSVRDILNLLNRATDRLYGQPLLDSPSVFLTVRTGLAFACVLAGFAVRRLIIRSGAILKGARIDITLFLIGAVVISFCFLIGTNYTYRCIFLILCVPLLLRTLTLDPEQNVIAVRLCWSLLALIAIVLWSNAILFNFPVDDDQVRRIAFGLSWLAIEVASLALVVLLTAYVWDLVLTAPLFRRAR
jgi:hypothetical protein